MARLTAGLGLQLNSPADMLITDAQGRRAGIDTTTGQVVSEIPGANCSDAGVHPQTCGLPSLPDGDYALDVTGTGTGPFSVDVYAGDREAALRTVRLFGSAEPGATTSYTVRYSSQDAAGLLVVGSDNLPPYAADDAAGTDEGQAVAIDVATNDADPDGTLDLTSVVIVAVPGSGMATTDPQSGVVTYTPTAGFSGSDTLRYSIRDEEGAVSNEALVTITIGDGDEIGASEDNCPEHENADQGDFDGDGIGDVCDNCDDVANAGQEDADDDGRGDACDGCPELSNEEDSDPDDDGIDDACDDDDGDGFVNSADNCVGIANASQTDADGDGIGDECDECPGEDDLACVIQGSPSPTPSPTATASPSAPATNTATPTTTPIQTIVVTLTPSPTTTAEPTATPTATNLVTPVPTATVTPLPPTVTLTPLPPTVTPTPVLPTITATPAPPTVTPTEVGPTPTNGQLSIRRARVRRSGDFPGEILLRADLLPGTDGDAIDVTGGLRVLVTDGLGLNDEVRWTSGECKRFTSGRIVCRNADRRLQSSNPTCRRTRIRAVVGAVQQPRDHRTVRRPSDSRTGSRYRTDRFHRGLQDRAEQHHVSAKVGWSPSSWTSPVQPRSPALNEALDSSRVSLSSRTSVASSSSRVPARFRVRDLSRR